MSLDYFIEWNEPLDKEAKYNTIVKAKAQDCAEYQKAQSLNYESLDQALEDFMLVHWAWKVN